MSPVVLRRAGRLTADERRAIAERLSADDFAVLDLASEPDRGPNTLRRLADSLGLGPAIVPALYREGSGYDGCYTSLGFNWVGGDRADGDHPAFARRDAQPLHVDGTLLPLGAVRTVLLLVELAAAVGGDSIVFRSAAAMEAMRQEHPEHFAVLMSARVRRAADIGDGDGTVEDVVFRYGPDGRIESWYSEVGRIDWYLDGASACGRSEKRLAAALACFRSYIGRHGFHYEFRLDGGNVLLLANDRVCHTRSAYQDSGVVGRRLWRGLFAESVAGR